MNAQTRVVSATLSEAMALAFAEIEAATKDANNPHFKSKYANLGAVIDAVKPALINHGLFFTQHCHPSDDGVMVETVLGHAGGEEKSLGRLFVPANKKDAQGFGSALTYARRYCLMTAFGVPTEDDDGNAATKSVANDRSGLKQQLQESVRQEDARPATKKDLPFPQGPAKNRTELKTLGRIFWRDVESSGDTDQLDIVLDTNRKLFEQLKTDLPSWLTGWEKDGQPYEGLDAVIERKREEFANEAWKQNPIAAG